VIIFTNVCVITLAMAILLRNLGFMFACLSGFGDNLLLRNFRPYGILFMIVCVYYHRFSLHY
jgi:hypothetical protein